MGPPAAGAAPVGILTFIDVRDASSAEASAILHREALASHRELLKEIARPDRFVLIARTDQEPPEGEASPGASLPDALGPLLVAPPDRRTHHDFGEPAAAASVSKAATTHAVYLIAHVDIGGQNQPAAQDALRAVELKARASAGNLRFDIWQQTNRANHYNIVAAWRSASDLEAFEASDAAREFRRIVAPLIGSLYDERRYRRVD
jgi:quinol monooxygenase YgiN